MRVLPVFLPSQEGLLPGEDGQREEGQGYGDMEGTKGAQPSVMPPDLQLCHE